MALVPPTVGARRVKGLRKILLLIPSPTPKTNPSQVQGLREVFSLFDPDGPGGEGGENYYYFFWGGGLGFRVCSGLAFQIPREGFWGVLGRIEGLHGLCGSRILWGNLGFRARELGLGFNRLRGLGFADQGTGFMGRGFGFRGVDP